MSVTIASLPADIGDLSEIELDQLHDALQTGGIRLDWSAVAIAPPAALTRLLAGLDLSRDAEVLGLETISDDLALLVEAALENGKRSTAASRRTSRATSAHGPAVWVAPADTASGVTTELERVEEEDGNDRATTDESETRAHGDEEILQRATPLAVRDEFERLVLGELLGPAGGVEEEVDENILDRYLVGKLAPREASILDDAERRDSTGDEDDVAEQASLDPAAHDDDLSVADEAEESRDDLTASGPRPAFPTSFGFTCTIAGDVDAVQVLAEWGRYDRSFSQTAAKDDGSPKLVWKRHPMGGRPINLPLAEGDIEPLRPEPTQPDVVIEGRIRRRDDDWAVTLFLRNRQELPRTRRGTAWLFQPKLAVKATDDSGVFVRRPLQAHVNTDTDGPGETDLLAMSYRDCLEFAVGHGVGVHAVRDAQDPTRASLIESAAIPNFEVPKTDTPQLDELPELSDLVLDMTMLAELDGSALADALTPLTAAYDLWIADQAERAQTEPDLQPHGKAAAAALTRCRTAVRRIREGITLLRSDARAMAAFRFMNQAMALQRIHTLYADARRRDEATEIDAFDVPKNRSWRPFQLAFILLNLPALTCLDHPERSADPDESLAVADLLWFPTGGGKTEAYLGLAAYAMAIRRLQGIVAGRSGEAGVTVLMRYTLRLLTLQQFQRATALVCACELIRREAMAQGDTRWGREPFRIGLWVGYRMTPNTTDGSAEAVKQDHGQFRRPGGGGGSPAQLTSCPWCGIEINPGRNIKVETLSQGRARTLIYCGDSLGRCAFSEKQAANEGLPVLVVDEEIYRRLPSLLIATVDKFAQLPWKGETEMLFGQVDGRCERHGFRSPEIEDTEYHNRRGNFPPARTVPVTPLRPPDLIIQDELHLISGPLGSLVGLYETAIDELTTWDIGGHRIHPKVVASTATIRQADEQIHALFGRQVEIFPPPGLDAGDSFFARQYPASDDYPSRKYIGICARGERLKVVLIRVYVAHLAAAQRLFDTYGELADPYMTLVGYFGSMRELGGMRRLVEDDIAARLRSTEQRDLARRRQPVVEELTSRKSSSEIPSILDRLSIPFEPRKGRKDGSGRKTAGPLDVLLATNMVSVGVDVPRLGLMVVAGQPKTTAEYIQATSRVGRRYPGFVCTVFNWARPRDLSHYERFAHYHATFYQQVEALSVTPFAPRALDRGLTALLVALLRLRGSEFNANSRAAAITRDHPIVKEAVAAIVARSHLVTQEKAVRDRVEAELARRLDAWLHEIQTAIGGRQVGYKTARDGTTQGILQVPGLGQWDLFTCLNSLRDVEPTVDLILDDRNLDEEPAVAAAIAEGGHAS